MDYLTDCSKLGEALYQADIVSVKDKSLLKLSTSAQNIQILSEKISKLTILQVVNTKTVLKVTSQAQN